MCAQLNQKDLDYFYELVKDTVEGLSEISPTTSEIFLDTVNRREKSPFEILYKLNRKLISASCKRTTLS